MRRTLRSLIVLTAAASFPALAASPSFNCDEAIHEAEQFICKDAELARLDRSMNELYAEVLASLPASERKRLKAEQRGWVKGRDDCWKSSDMRGCIADSYRDRIDELEDR